MNPDRIVHGRVTINGEKSTLGRAQFKVLIQRLTEKYRTSTYRGEKLQLIIEVSDDPLPGLTILSREDQLAHELQANIITDGAEEVFPGVTLARMLEVAETELYEKYNHICEPSHRIGVPDETIREIRTAYSLEFPDCVAYFPLWRDS